MPFVLIGYDLTEAFFSLFLKKKKKKKKLLGGSHGAGGLTVMVRPWEGISLWRYEDLARKSTRRLGYSARRPTICQ